MTGEKKTCQQKNKHITKKEGTEPENVRFLIYTVQRSLSEGVSLERSS